MHIWHAHQHLMPAKAFANDVVSCAQLPLRLGRSLVLTPSTVFAGTGLTKVAPAAGLKATAFPKGPGLLKGGAGGPVLPCWLVGVVNGGDDASMARRPRAV